MAEPVYDPAESSILSTPRSHRILVEPVKSADTPHKELAAARANRFYGYKIFVFVKDNEFSANWFSRIISQVGAKNIPGV